MMLWEQFDRNEWFVLIMLIAAYGAILILPKKLPRQIAVTALIWGFASSTLLDFTIGGGLIDFYIVNDTDQYELTDLFTYFLFAPFAYFFIYFYEVLKISKKTAALYIAGWTLIGVVMHVVATWMKMTQYQNGYRMEYNIVVFLIIQSITALYYSLLKRRGGTADKALVVKFRSKRTGR